MVEPLMYVTIGFIAAALLVLGVIPLVHGRAVRLTMRRLEALTPLSMAEIQADKDQLRAEFAMSTRRLEMSVEQMKAKTTSQLGEIGKKSEAIGRLKLELGEKTAALFALEAKEKQLADELADVSNELATKSAALEEAERALAEAHAELAQVSGNFHESSVAAGSQRVELVALRAQSEALQGQLEAYEQESKELTARLRHKTSELATLAAQFAEERAKADHLANRVSELDRALIAQTTEAEVVNRRVEELNARLDEQGRFLADREYVSDRLRNEAASAQKTETEIRAELAGVESRHRLASEAIRTEKALIEEQLRQSQEERTRLEQEIAAMKRDAESAWASERMENAVLRERINDVAAEVARLTATLEGPASAIDAILNRETAHPTVGANGTNGNGVPSIAPGGVQSKGTLADRIRALQSRASRATQTGGS
jgi:chromosome segregation ATPase